MPETGAISHSLIRSKEMIPARKENTNWKYVFVVTLLAVAAGGVFSVQYAGLAKELSAASVITLPTTFPLLTSLNNNFLKQINDCFIPTAAVYGYTLRITSGYRSMEEQQAIYDSGREVNGHIVTWAEPGRSLHNYGYAVDMVDRWRGFDIDWQKLAKIGAYCGLEQVDDDHFEHRSGLTTDDFAAGKRPPLLKLPCKLMAERADANQPLTFADLKQCGAPIF